VLLRQKSWLSPPPNLRLPRHNRMAAKGASQHRRFVQTSNIARRELTEEAAAGRSASSVYGYVPVRSNSPVEKLVVFAVVLVSVQEKKFRLMYVAIL